MKNAPTTHTEIAFILDRSGSMESIRDATIAGFNDFLRDQQSAAGQTRLTLVLFDDWIETQFVSFPIAEAIALSRDTFVPRGTTSLLDAIGETVNTLGERLAAMPEDQRPDHVCVAILTDGEENSSGRFTWKDISECISHQTQKYDWEFLFLGAGPDAIATAAKLSIQRENTACYVADSAGQQAASAAISSKISAKRRMKSGYASLQEIEEANRPLEEILRDEDRKRRPQ